MIRTTIAEDLVPGALLLQAHPAVIDRVLYDVASGARDYWIKRAGERLHSSLRDYVNGIQAVELEPGRAVITLLGVVPNMVENGADKFSMHEGLLGPNVPLAMPGERGKHINAKGQFYRAIPFRHQVVGTAGKGGGAVMGSAYSGMMGVMEATKLGKAVHAAAKKLKPSTGMPGAPVKWGKRLPAGVGGAVKLKAHHTTDIYAGMVKSQKTYAKATQNTYITFRTISEAHPEKFIHPGITAVNLSADVQHYVEETLPKALLAMLGANP